MGSDRTPPRTESQSHPYTRTMHFDDNKQVSILYGQFDQNLTLIEKELDVHATASGNHVVLSGSEVATTQAERVLQDLWVQVKKGLIPDRGDVMGAIRMAKDQGGLFENKPSKQATDMNMTTHTDPPQTSDSTGRAEIKTRKKTILARTHKQSEFIEAMKSKSLIFAAGPAGTGKTYLAVAYAAMLLDTGQVERVILSRPAVEAGERLGFLPGDMKEKVDPYLRPLYDALYDTLSGEKVERGMQTGQIEVAPLAFMRGRTLSNAAIILDEAQNATVIQTKMFLTRLGENAKMIVTGDPSQIDLPGQQQSGLQDAIERLAHIKAVATIRFTNDDVVRHPLVTEIVKAYDART